MRCSNTCCNVYIVQRIWCWILCKISSPVRTLHAWWLGIQAHQPTLKWSKGHHQMYANMRVMFACVWLLFRDFASEWIARTIHTCLYTGGAWSCINSICCSNIRSININWRCLSACYCEHLAYVEFAQQNMHNSPFIHPVHMWSVRSSIVFVHAWLIGVRFSGIPIRKSCKQSIK